MGKSLCFQDHPALLLEARPPDAALAAYPEARVELGDQAITLHPSRPPIARIA